MRKLVIDAVRQYAAQHPDLFAADVALDGPGDEGKESDAKDPRPYSQRAPLPCNGRPRALSLQAYNSHSFRSLVRIRETSSQSFTVSLHRRSGLHACQALCLLLPCTLYGVHLGSRMSLVVSEHPGTFPRWAHEGGAGGGHTRRCCEEVASPSPARASRHGCSQLKPISYRSTATDDNSTRSAASASSVNPSLSLRSYPDVLLTCFASCLFVLIRIFFPLPSSCVIIRST